MRRPDRPSPTGRTRRHGSQRRFCDGQRGCGRGQRHRRRPEPKDTERLVWRTTAFLLPDDYADTYGLHLFGDWLRLGVNGSFGF